MLDRFLLIGLGGSGGATVRYAAAGLQRALLRAGWEQGLPQEWQFMHIDAPASCDVQADLPRELDERVAYVGLGRKPETYQQYDDAISRDADLVAATAGWRPNPLDANVRMVLPYTGAGQMRAVGRVVGMRDRPKMEQEISRAILRCQSGGGETLIELGQHLARRFGDVINRTPELRVVVVTSFGGGAGSGLFQDVLDLLLNKLGYANPDVPNNIVVVAYTPDVSALNSGVRGVPPNSFAAMSEYMHGFEAGKLPRVNLMLVGSSGPNQMGAMDTDRDVYRYVGGTLSKLFSDPAVLQRAANFIFQNPQPTEFEDAFPFGSAFSIRAANSFGSASVSLGQDLFERYASERLASHVLERLLRGHRGLANDAQQSLGDEQLINQLADGLSASFFGNTGLDEQGPANQVLDALDGGTDGRTATENAIDAFLQESEGRLGQVSGERPRDELIDDAQVVWQESAGTLAAEYRVVEERAAAWIPDVQQRFLDAVARNVAQYGVPLTVAFIERLAESMERARSEMLHDAKEALDEADRLSSNALGALQRLPTRVAQFLRRPEWGRWQIMRSDEMHARLRAHRRQMAAQILFEAVDGLLNPTRTGLTQLEAGLTSIEHDAAVQQWAGDGDVPTHLMPPVNEHVLVKPETWRDLFGELLTTTFGAGVPLELAIEEVVSGLRATTEGLGTPEQARRRWPRTRDQTDAVHQTLLALETEWRPEVNTINVPNAATPQRRNRASVSFDGTGKLAADLMERCTEWVRVRDGAFSAAVTRSLADWVATDPVGRSTQLATGVQSALTKSRPMVNLNNSVLGFVHGDTGETCLQSNLIIGSIPLSNADHSAARGSVAQALVAAGIDPAHVDGCFNPDSGRSDIEMIAVTKGSFHMVAAESLMGPVRSDWDEQPQAFMANRRAMPLDRFVPLDPRWQVAIARGYLTAMILGHVPVRWNDRTWADGPIEVWTPEGTRKLPRTLFGVANGAHVSSSRDLLPHLVASFPVALVELSGGKAESIEAYARLVHLGTPENANLADYSDANDQSEQEKSFLWDLNGELEAWIARGTRTAGTTGGDAPLPDAEYYGTPEMEPVERRDLILARLDATFRRVYNDELVVELNSANARRPGAAWELRGVVSSALDQLIRGIGEYRPASEDVEKF